MTDRLHDWPARLQAVVTRAHAQRFAWGEHDCVLWAADCVQAQTGIDLMARYRGAYSTPKQAYRLLRAEGGLRGAGDYAGPRIAPAMAAEGDIGLVRGCRPMLGVMLGGVWMVASTVGLRALPRDAAVMAWGVSRG